MLYEDICSYHWGQKTIHQVKSLDEKDFHFKQISNMRFITVTRSNDCNSRTFVQLACKHCYLRQLLGFYYSAIQGALLFLIIERLTVCISLAFLQEFSHR